MAALSYYSNWDSLPQWDSGDVAIDDPELQSLHDAWNTDYSVDLSDMFFPAVNNYCNSSLLPYDFNNGAPFHNLNSFDSPQQEFESFNYPSYFNPCLTMLQDYVSPEIMTPLPDFPVGEFSMGKGDAGGGGGSSAQSVAARQRRRRITDKTRELGKLVPGGQKMNTAEMLHSAHKYIKFLEAQAALLQFVASPPQEVTFEDEEEFQKLLESPLIQEKLYSTEHCLLPRKFVEQLGTHVKLNAHSLPISEQDDK